jgi:aspartate-semialdehyde dehydrogenase
VGSTVAFRGERWQVEEATPKALEGTELVFFAATGELSKTLAPAAVERGAIVIDKSSTWRMDPSVPLVIPEINAHALDGHRGIIACPNCTTTGLVMALEPLRRAAGLRSVVVTTFQAVSGSGREGLAALERQRAARHDGTAPEVEVYPSLIADNVIAQCDGVEANGYTTEELKLLNETRKIFEQPELEVTMTAVRVPVSVGHSAAVLLETQRELSPNRAARLLNAFPGVRYVDAPAGPTPLDVVDSDEVLVGRLRKDFAGRRLWLWEVSNNLRKGAATNAIQVAEALLERRLL